MTITIGNRFTPFSHLPGTICLIPASQLACEVFPALIRFYDVSSASKLVAEIFFSDLGPIREFTVFSDLERGVIRISGFMDGSCFRYHITSSDSGFIVDVIKLPVMSNASIRVNSASYRCALLENGKLSENRQISFCGKARTKSTALAFHEKERLSLGSHKAQDIEMILRRRDLTEILPLWYFLAQSHSQSSVEVSANSLFYDAQKAVLERGIQVIYDKLLALYLVGFKSLLFPTLQDSLHQGLKEPTIVHDLQNSPLLLLEKSYALLRSLFIEESDEKLHILPALPQQFHCGKMVNVAVRQVGRVSLEWTKKMIRQVIVDATADAQMKFRFHSDVKRFRISELTTRTKLGIFQIDSSLTFQQGKKYLLDHFEK